MKTSRLISLLLAAALALPACRQGGAGQPSAARPLRAFEYPDIPAVYTDPDERAAFLLDHFWDRFFAGDGPCDTGAVLGVAHAEVEKQVATYTQLLSRLPLAQAQDRMRRFFRQIESRQAADTASHVYLLMEEIVSRYLYDPNSPVRDEDLYLPFVEGLAASPYTREEARPGYVYQARMCARAARGSVAPDFTLTDLRGRVHTLHGVQARTTLLFFSNPGCYACQEITNRLQAVPGIEGMIQSGALAVVGAYIDDEVDLWRKHAAAYPASWICGYNADKSVRDGDGYDIRAIPSLYLLDADKRVLLKDAPVERVIAYLQNQQNR